MWDRDAIDMAFVREFQTGGAVLFGPVSSMERRERIRIAILRNGRERITFHDSGMTYGEAFLYCYRMPIDRRSHPRDVPRASHVEEPLEDDEDDTDDENPDWP